MKDTITLREALTGALIGLVRATKGNEDLLLRVTEEKKRIVPDCAVCLNPCGRTENYDIRKLQTAPEEIYSLKSLIPFCVRELASCACRAVLQGHTDEDVDHFLYQALFVLGFDHWSKEQYLSFLEEMGRIHLKCITLLEMNQMA